MDDQPQPHPGEPPGLEPPPGPGAPAGPETPPGPAAPPPHPDAHPGPPPPPPGWGSPVPSVGWIPPAEALAGPRIDIGSIIGRTFDTFGREWSLFLALALPAGLGGLLEVLITPGFQDMFTAARTGARYQPDEGPVLLATLVVLTLSGISSLACVVAADRLWRGLPTGLSDAVAGTLRAIPRAIVLWLLAMAFAVVGILPTILFSPGSAYPYGSGSAYEPPSEAFLAALPLFLLLGFAAVVVVLVVTTRLSLVLPVIALEDASALDAIRRCWRLTRGHAIMLFAMVIAIGLCAAFPVWGGSLFYLFGENRLVAALALGFATAVAAPLSGIWTAIAYGDLVGGRHADSAVMARGSGRRVSAALVIGLGTVLLVAGIGVAGAGLERFLALGS